MRTLAHPSPVGPLILTSHQSALVGCAFSERASRDAVLREEAATTADSVLDLACEELDRFFAGELREFSVPVSPPGTEFQRSVWRALQQIPYGTTRSYGQIARSIGRPAAVRAVGAANGQNPICIIVPCHRVIGADGSLTGFGGGLERKSFLLGLERGQAPLFGANDFVASSSAPPRVSAAAGR